MRIERVILEHHRDVARLGRHVIHDPVADFYGAGADRFEAGDHPQRGTFPATGWPDEHDELSVFDIEIDAIDGYLLSPFSIYLADTLESHSRHTTSFTRK